MTCGNTLFLGVSATTVAEELKHNPRLTKSKEEFVQIIKDLGLAKPKKMGKLESSLNISQQKNLGTD